MDISAECFYSGLGSPPGLKVIWPSRLDSLLLQPSTFQAWPRSVVSPLASRAGRVVLKGPGPEESREEESPASLYFIWQLEFLELWPPGPGEKSLLLAPEQAPALLLSPHWLLALGKGQIIPLS